MAKSRLRGAARGGALALVLALAVSACSSDGSDDQGTDVGGSSADAEAAVAAAQDKVAEYSSPDQQFPEVGPAFDAGTGTAAVITLGSAAPVVQLNAERAVEAFRAMGWTAADPLDGEFNPSVIGGLIDSAVADKVDAITFTSVNVEDSGESIKNALDAGVTLTCVMCPMNTEYADLGVIYATIDFQGQGEILGWYIIDRSEGTGTVVNTADPGSRATVVRAAGVTKIVKENCSTCTVLDDLIIPSADIALPGPPQWSAFLNSHPEGDVTDAVGMADVLGVPMAKTLGDIGRTDIKVTGYDADDAAVELVGTPDSVYAGTVALPYYWGAWAGADLAARQVAGEELWDASKMPMLLITPETVGDFTEFTPGSDWQDTFKSAWGV
jgi:ABC-type sugar transport system substrate-binding protein